MSHGLSGVRQAIKERRQERFTALLQHMTVTLLHDSFYALKRQAAPGVDGVTWQEVPSTPIASRPTKTLNNPTSGLTIHSQSAACSKSRAVQTTFMDSVKPLTRGPLYNR